jgi:hypothetical protein
MTDMTLSSFLFGDILPQATFKRVTLEQTSQEQSRTTLKLMFKNTIESGEAVNFFDEDDIYNHFSAFIFVSFDKDATNFLIENYNNILDPNVRGKGIGNLGSPGSGEYNFEAYKKGEVFKKENSAMMFDTNGNRVVSTSLDFPHLFANSDRHLTYFVVLGVDVNNPDFLQEFGIQDASQFAGLQESIYNKPVIFKAIDNNQIVSSRMFFTTMDDKVWLRDITVDKDAAGNLIFTGDDLKGSIDLKLKMTPQNIVQDFRDLDKFTTPQISKFEADLTEQKTQIKLLNNDNSDVIRKETYVSNVYLSRDFTGVAKILFSVDYLNMLSDKSLFGNFIKDANFDLYRDQTRISSLKVIRRRVKNTKDKNRLNSSFAASNVLFDNEEVEEIVILSNDEEGTLSFQEQKGGTNQISELDLSFSNDKRIRTFNVLDASLNLKTYGIYQYGVEIQVQDKSAVLFQTILANLQVAKQQMLQYYEDSLSYSFVNDRREKHYEQRTDTFTPAFLEFYNKKYINSFFISNAHSQIGALYNLIGTVPYKQKTINSLNSMVDPITGTPKGILTFIEFIGSNISLINKILNQTLSKTEPKSNLNFSSTNKTAAEKGGGQRTIEYRTFFTTDFANVEDDKFIGIDYLNQQSKATTGLNVFDKSSFDNIVTNIKNIYYPENATRTFFNQTSYGLETAQYSFLSPQTFRFGPNRLLATNNLYPQEADLILQNIINYNINKDSENYLSINNPENSTKTNNQAIEENLLRQIYSYFSVVFPILENTDGDPVKLVNTPISGRVSKFGFNSNINPIPDGVIDEEPDFYQDPTFIMKKLLQTFLENNSFSKSADTFNLFAKNKSYNKISLTPSAPSISPQDANIGNFSIATNPAPAPGEYDMNTEEVYDPTSNEDNAIINLIKNFSYFDRVEILTTNKTTDKQTSITNQQASDLILRLPNQVKSLFAWKNNQDIPLLNRIPGEVDIILEKNSIFVILFTMLKKVEYLAGYEVLSEGNKIKNEKWDVLDLNAINNLSDDKYLLCRMVDYNPEELGLSKSDILNMPILNKYFLITR